MLISAGLAEAHDIPATFQGSWRGMSCLVDSGFAAFPESIRDRVILDIGRSVLTVRATSFTRTLNTLARMPEASGITASPTRKPMAGYLRSLDVATVTTLGVEIKVDPSAVLEGVSLHAGSCSVAPQFLVARPGEGRPSGAAVPTQECLATSLFHYPDADHVAMPSDGPAPCLEVFERVP